MTLICRTSFNMARCRSQKATLIILLSFSVTVGFLLHTSVRRYQDATILDSHQTNPISREIDPHALDIQTDDQWRWLSYLGRGGEDQRAEGIKEDVTVTVDRDEGEVKYGKDGLVRGWEDRAAEKTRGYAKISSRVRHSHPIHDLIKRGNEKWAALLERQSKTLPQAVIEYKRRYGRPPPRGFEQWWKYAKRHGIRIVDDYDQIDRDIAPYFALSPQTFRQRVEQLESEPHSYKITLDPHGPSKISGNRSTADRPKLLFGLLEPIAQYLPETVSFQGSDHDLGSWLLGDDQKQAALQAVREHRYFTPEEIKRYQQREGRVEVKGLAAACPVGSMAWNQSLAIQAGLSVQMPEQEATFVHDPMASYDFCSNPSHLQTHGTLSFDFTRESQLRPLFQWSKHLHNPEFLATPLEAYQNHTSPHATKNYTPWSQKTDNRVFWRGSSTGDFYTKEKHKKVVDWRHSHRTRLGLMALAKEGKRKVWMQRGLKWYQEEWGLGKLNEKYLDVGLTGKPHQCANEDGTCDDMAAEITFLDRVKPEDAAKFKYALDVDGNGWSSRFHRLMMSGSVVVKSTIFPEWISDWLIPWVHYVPIQVDYSDLYNTMSFFAGPPNTSRKGGGGNDHLAQAIAEQAKKFGEEHWRWEDMQGYMFRLLLEYTRLLAEDRDAASYHRGYERVQDQGES